jgi:hypothetical protein
MDESILSLTDETGKTLACQVEITIEVDREEYLLLRPIDHAVYIFAWGEGDDEEDQLLLDIEEEELDRIFSIAQAVLSEQNLKLQRTAYTLTASGELPEELDEDEVFTIDAEDEEASEEFLELAHFFYEEQEYSIFTSLDPLMFFAKLDGKGNPQLLTPEEIQRIQPYVEEHLMDPDEKI